MKGEAIARVRRQQGVALKNQFFAGQAEGREAMNRLKGMYSFQQKDYAGTYGGTVELVIKPRAWWQFWK